MRLTRRGFALVELLVALGITALVGGVIFRLVDRSQRFARGIAAIADQRAQLAVAAYAVETELQGAAPTDGDLIAPSDSAIAYLGKVGSAVACNVAGSAIDLAPQHLASGITIAWWNTAPQAGDSVLVLDEGGSRSAADDRWLHLAASGVTSLPNACLYSPYVDSIADAGKVGWRITTATPLPLTVVSGAAVQVVRPQRFALYRSASEWMLGWTEWNPLTGAWNVIQPVAGPLLPYAAGAATSGPATSGPAISGFALAWRDSLGVSLPAGAAGLPRSVSLTLGAITRQAVRMDGVRAGLRRDSLSRHIALRTP